MPRWLKFVILAFVLLMIGSIPLAMQFENGSIEGIITDSKGPVAGAAVEARNIMSGAVWREVSDEKGYYKLAEVRAGRYSLWVHAPDHSAAWLQRIIVDHGQHVHQDVRLTQGGPETSQVKPLEFYAYD